jgi:DNA-binding CsgD family transcriptional regulator
VLESEIVRRRTALLVTDARQHLRTLKPMMAAGNVSSYVVAPIVIERRVIGLLQADRRGQPREVDETDRLNLAMFASELSLLLECLTLRERVKQQRNQLQASLLEATRAAGAILDEELTLMPHTPPATPAASDADAPPAAPGLWTAFTPRQQEVLQLMLTGAPNRQIAADLGIALATVKSHVKAILRTLRVSSRSEAVARLIDQHSVGA